MDLVLSVLMNVKTCRLFVCLSVVRLLQGPAQVVVWYDA